ELDTNIENLKRYYWDQGYLDMIIENEREGLVQYNPTGTEATLNFKLKEGPVIKVGSIVVDGLTQTQELVVRMELEFAAGDLLTPQRIQDSQYRLQRLGLFSLVDISTLETGTPISERTIIVKVLERDPGFFTSGLGLSNEFDLTV